MSSSLLLLGVGISAGMIGYYVFHKHSIKHHHSTALLSSHDLTHGLNKFYNPHYTHDPSNVEYRHPQDFSRPSKNNRNNITYHHHHGHHNQQPSLPLGRASVMGSQVAEGLFMQQYNQHIHKLWNLDYGHAPVPHSHWELGPVPWVRDQQDANDLERKHAYSRVIPIPHQDIHPGDIISLSNMPINRDYISSSS